ncbi:MAG: hypothetical protein ABR583_00025 [Gaiellaceae bacterium]
MNRRSDVVVRHVRGGRAVTIGSLQDQTGGCTFVPCGVVLAGDRAAYWYEVGALNLFRTLFTASVPGLDEQKLETLGRSPAPGGDQGDHLVGPAGDGRLLVYGVTTVEAVDPRHVRISGGKVVRLVAGRPRRVPGVGPAALLDVAAGRLAVVPAVRRAHTGGGGVELRDARSGVLLRTIRFGGTPAGLALSGRIAAVLLQRNPPRIERYAIATGNRLATTTLPAMPIGGIDASLDTVVFQRAKAVWMVDATGRVRRLAQTPGTLVGASIEGRRVAWAENRGGRGYVRALTAPVSDALRRTVWEETEARRRGGVPVGTGFPPTRVPDGSLADSTCSPRRARCPPRRRAGVRMGVRACLR